MEITMPAQKEALINELKGNLFEYLVGQNLALKKGILPQFYKNFGGQIKNQLVEYENWLRKNDPILFKNLPQLATSLAEKLAPQIPDKLDNLLVVGMASKQHRFYEADLLAIKNDQVSPISIKLCKAKAFVNTKSGGVKSIILKYFNQFEKAPTWQQELNEVLNLSFQTMGHELYSQIGQEFNGGFDERWELSHLPGGVPDRMKTFIRKFYSQVIQKIYEIFLQMNKESPSLLKKCLYPIMGFGNSAIIQATCFHGAQNGEKYNLKGIKILTGEELEEELEVFMIEPIKEDLSSFEIKLKTNVLQIRVKPMNIFTTPAVKINCSIKETL